jgi:hypothetical protein
LELWFPSAVVTAGKTRSRLRLVTLAVLAAAFCAAVSAHVGIDIAGDYVLRVDAYDHLAHGSRELFTLIAVLCASGAGVILMRRLFAAASTLPSRVRLLTLSRTYVLPWYAAVAALALVAVPLMECVDALRDGSAIESLADAFGGSMLLGTSITLVCAAAICTLLFGLVAWLCRYRNEVARLVEALVSPERSPLRPGYAERGRASIVTRARELRAQRRCKRGPPRLCERPLLVFVR